MRKKITKTNHSVRAVQMKNWEPFELGPLLAIDRVPVTQMKLKQIERKTKQFEKLIVQEK